MCLPVSKWIVKGIYELPHVAYNWLCSQNRTLLLGSSHLFFISRKCLVASVLCAIIFWAITCYSSLEISARAADTNMTRRLVDISVSKLYNHCVLHTAAVLSLLAS